MLKLRLTTWNKNLVDARKSTGHTQPEFARLACINPVRYHRIETLKLKPSEDERLRISVVIGIPDDYLFPSEVYQLYDKGILEKKEVVLTKDELKELNNRIEMRSLPSAEDDYCNNVELPHFIQGIISHLPAKEKQVLIERFGIGGGGGKSQEAVGKLFNVTGNRIHQVEKKALRRLRHPRYSRQLKDYI